MKKKTIKILRKGAEMLCLILAFSMLVCSVPMVAEEVATEPGTVDVVKMIKNVDRGTRVGKEDIEIVKVKNVNVPANIISDPKEVEYLYAKENLYAGEYVSKNQISESKVAKANDELLLKPISKCDDDFVVVTDYVVPNTGECLAAYLQQIIDANPRKTVYFPDGEYVISMPLFTSADGQTSTSIQLSDGAVIKASKNFSKKDGNALICLGGARHMNDIVSVGSYYVLSGGTLDGNAVANGVSVDSGRESVIRNICIKNVRVGIYVARGANNGSSDLDFEDITIIGMGMLGTTGVEVDGWDNTFTNIRIYNMAVGMHIATAGNLIKSIYVYNDPDKLLGTMPTEGIKTSSSTNWVSQCHVVNAQRAYAFGQGCKVWDCSAEWTSAKVKNQTMFSFNGNSLTVSGCRADFCPGDGVNTSLVSGNASVKFIEATVFNASDVTDKNYEKYLVSADTVIPWSK